MKVIAKIDYPGIFDQGKEYEVAGIILQGVQGEYDPCNFEFVGNSYEACGKYVPQIGEEYECRRKAIGTEKFELHKTTPVQAIRKLGAGYYYVESQNNRYWLRVN
ncbi:MAG: hypothetical protein HXK68_01125 [Clostridiales bacterium]|nr:hypothetical protein [Clostridiales bacterium]